MCVNALKNGRGVWFRFMSSGLISQGQFAASVRDNHGKAVISA